MEIFSLRSLRKNLGLNQEQLAAILEVSRNHLSQIEIGARPISKKMKRKIEEFLKEKEQNVVRIGDVRGPANVVAGKGNSLTVHPAGVGAAQGEPPPWAVAMEARLSAQLELCQRLLLNLSLERLGGAPPPASK